MLVIEYELLVFSLELKTSVEEEDRGNIDGARPSGMKMTKEEIKYLKGWKDSFKKEASDKIYASKHILEPIEFIVQDDNFQEHAYVDIEIGEQI